MRAAVIIVLPGSRNAISQFRTLQPWQGRLSCLSDLVRCCRGPHVDGVSRARYSFFEDCRIFPLIFCCTLRWQYL